MKHHHPVRSGSLCYVVVQDEGLRVAVRVFRNYIDAAKEAKRLNARAA